MTGDGKASCRAPAKDLYPLVRMTQKDRMDLHVFFSKKVREPFLKECSDA
jgi:hypothetical protein